MQSWQKEFLELSLELDILRFGSFTLKSGRESPYFFNAGLFSSGRSLGLLGRYYAQAIHHAGTEFDMLLGPAYKGIPLAAAIAIGFEDLYQRDLPFAYNRKEAKDHGEGGVLVGAPLRGRVLVVDDVISAGTSIREAVRLIESAGAELAGVAVALDRQERGEGEHAASREVELRYGAPVISILDLGTLIDYLGTDPALNAVQKQVLEYRSTYGPRS